MVWMFAITELVSAPCHRVDVLWFPFALWRSTVAKDFPGGFSQATRIVMREAFLHDKIRDGFIVDADGACLMLHLGLSNLVSDADAWRAILAVKGASGKLCCPVCLNLTTDKAKLAAHPAELCGLHESDLANAVRASDEDLRYKVVTIAEAARTESETRVRKLQTVLGVNHCPEGILADAELRAHFLPISILTMDSMHNMCNHGCGQQEMGLMLHRLSRLAPPVPHDHVETFFAADWRVASTIGTPSCLAGIGSQTRVDSSYRNGSSFATSASEFLLAYHVFPRLPGESGDSALRSRQAVREF